MTITTCPPPGVGTRRVRLDHPVCRGDFPALVFSGARADLGELPGEPTSRAALKHAMVDPRHGAGDDFARSPGMPLPVWPEADVRPIRGVCFVLGDAAHPAVERLEALGGESGEHFVVAADLLEPPVSDRDRALGAFVDALDDAEDVVLLGYGDQGAQIAARLVGDLGLDRVRLVVVEHAEASARRAAGSGLRVAAADAAGPGAVIYTPLARHDRLDAIAREAAAAGRPVFDNRTRSDSGPFHRRVGRVDLDAAAFREFRVDGTVLAAGDHGLPTTAFVVRDEVRRLRGVDTRWLRSGWSTPARAPDDPLDLARPEPTCALGSASFVRLERAYVSTHADPAPSVFAGRSFCQDLWPEATDAVFPSRHPSDMGVTSLERVLQRHIGRCEIAMVSQTSAEQVALGVLARHHAPDAPIVEIGSALGGSALLMAVATGTDGDAVISIDPDTASRDVMRFLFDREGLAHRLNQVVATSDDAAPGLRELEGRAGIVFIDGLHTEAAVRRDVANYASLVRPGGALLLHDVEPGWYTVMRAVIETLLPDPRFVLTAIVDSLAVFRRRASHTS